MAIELVDGGKFELDLWKVSEQFDGLWTSDDNSFIKRRTWEFDKELEQTPSIYETATGFYLEGSS